MSSTTADYCIEFEGAVVCGTRMEERSRKSMGERWCFRHRARHEFFEVWTAPIGESYYGPNVYVVGPERDCSDLFPGWVRNYEEEW